MYHSLKLLVAAACGSIVLTGCTEISEFFLTGDPADVSTCAFVEAEAEVGEGLLCVECNSDSAPTASASYCGAELSARCNSDLDEPVYGIAVGAFDGAGGMTGTAWVDVDEDGADSDDAVICHEQSLEALSAELDGGKQEYKCTSALTGNGKTATTFEFELKYNPENNDCT